MNKIIFLLSTTVLLLFAACQNDGHKVVMSVDVNGYKYETVTNDPFKARIYTLDNGLKVYLSQNQDEPRIQTKIAVRAGSKNDPRNNTGLAHYLEHMMFKGSTHLGTSDWEKEKILIDSISNLFERHKAAQTAEEKKAIYKQIDAVSQAASKYAISNEYDKVVSSMGASGTNAYTGNDMTVYVNDIPSNELDRFLKLEADRFSNIVLRLFHTELETVYEEFNRSQDNANSLLFDAVLSALFDKHPYKVPIIGLPEHLKSPSMKSVMDFFRTYYVPNNMAVCLSGDLDFEKTVKLVDTHFGQMKPNENLPKLELTQEDPLTEIQIREVFTPESEMMMMAYRTPGVKSADIPKLEMIASLLSNGKAGLIDLNLLQKQQVLWAGVGAEFLTDYGLFYLYGAPRQGQTLEELQQLLLGELNKLKAGEFDGDLIEAVINNSKLAIIRKTDGRGACDDFADAFISGIDWKDYISSINEMAKLTKKDIIQFANDFFVDNYAVVLKRTGENKDKVMVEKPEITPIQINREVESELARELFAQKPEPIEPVFIDFNEKIKKQSLQDGVDFYYTKNETNQIYELNNFVEISSQTDKKLALAFSYLPYLGTTSYTPEQLSLEMYKLGMSFNAYSSGTRSYVTLSGLSETMNRSITLMEEILQNPVADENAYQNMIMDILKERENAKLNKNTILRRGLFNYVRHGEKSAFTDILTEDELKAIQAQELIDLIKGFSDYKQGYFYYGPRKESDVIAVLKNIKRPKTLQDVPAEVTYPELPMNKPAVYFADYDMIQTEIMLLAKDVLFDVSLLPYQSMFNSFYGSGMNSIIFQEIREARALAYSAYAYVSQPSRPQESNYITAYVGTQPDKMIVAMEAFKSLLTEMSQAPTKFEASKEFVLNNMRTERIIKSNIFWTYMNMQRYGIDYDVRKPIFEKIQSMTFDDLNTYFNAHIKPANHSVLIIGKKDQINFNYLKKYGEIKEIPLETLFGY